VRWAASILFVLSPVVYAAGSPLKSTTPDAQLEHAVRTGDHGAAGRLLAAGADPNRPLPDGSTLLAWAVERQDGEMVKRLLARKANVEGGADPAAAALIVACQYGDPSIVGLLLDARANVNVARPDGIGPLALCAGSAPPEIVTRLVSAGATVDKVDAQGQTPLMWAAAKGRIGNMRVLLANGAQVNRQTPSGFTPLFFALKSGEPRAPVALVEAGADVDHVAADGTSAVQLAMYQKDFEFAARMIRRGVDVHAFDRNGHTLLHAAVLANQPSLVSLLLAKGSNPKRLTGLSRVERRYEVNYRSDPYEEVPKPPLLLAAEGGFAEVMQLLVDAGADVGYRSQDGTNIVHAAARSGKLPALALALEWLPDPNTTDRYGQTPLHLLLQGDGTPDTEAMMRLIAEKGGRTDLRDGAGQTAAEAALNAQRGPRSAFVATFGERTANL
jgi:ankyrin repeat protein